MSISSNQPPVKLIGSVSFSSCSVMLTRFCATRIFSVKKYMPMYCPLSTTSTGSCLGFHDIPILRPISKGSASLTFPCQSPMLASNTQWRPDGIPSISCFSSSLSLSGFLPLFSHVELPRPLICVPWGASADPIDSYSSIPILSSHQSACRYSSLLTMLRWPSVLI